MKWLPFPDKSKARGFTLVEMMIVLAIIAILSAVATPSLNRMRVRESSRQFAENIANQLKMARAEARTQGHPLLVTINYGNYTASPPSKGSLQIQQGQPYCRSNGAPPGASGTCPNNKLPRYPVSCAELNRLVNRLDFASNAVESPNLATIGSDNYIVGSSANQENQRAVTLCFSPDGRVLAADGTKLTDPDNLLCSGENFMLMTAFGVPPTTLVYNNGKSIRQLSACKASQDYALGRDEQNVYRILVPYNGAIRVVQ